MPDRFLLGWVVCVPPVMRARTPALQEPTHSSLDEGTNFFHYVSAPMTVAFSPS